MVQTDFRSRLKKLFSNQAAYVNLGGNKMKVIDINDRQLNSTPNNFQFQDFDRFGRLYSTLSYGSAYSPIVAMSYQLAKIELYKSYEDMDRDSILATALDIYSDSVTQENEYGDILRIQSNNQNVQDVLTNLFHDILNIDFNLWTWVRNMMKYGDFYLKLNILDGHGIVNVQPLSTYSMIRVEDLYNPNQEIKFIYDPSFGIDHGMYGRNVQNFDDYEIAHFRLISDSNFLPYGRSLLEPARKSWEQLVMLEDAMLINRIMRAPSKRIFKIDIGNIPPNEIDNYMEQLVSKMKKIPYMDEQTGQMNLRFNLMNMMEDYYLPVRGGNSGTSIETLDGLEFTGIDDIEYIKNRMLAALRIPKAFIGYDESVEGKCLAPDTKIMLYNGGTLTIKEISDLFLIKEDPDLWVHSFDFETNSVIPTKIKLAEKTRLNAQVVRVYLNNNTYIDCTPDHHFILIDGTQIEAQNLQPEDLLLGIAHNHSIDKIEWLDEKIDTYNLEVNHKCHNYLIKNDIFISNSTLAAEDLRFAASAGRAQKIVLSELYKIALIHLYCQGFKNEDLIDFTLRLTPASTIYEKEKIEVWKSKLDVAQAALDQKILPRKWIYENVFHMAEAEWDVTQENIIDDAKYAYRLEQINSNGVDPKSEIQLEKEKLLGSESGDKPKEKPEGDSNEEPNKPTEKTDKEKPIEKKPLTPKKGNEKEPEKATKKTEKKPGEESKKKKPLTAGYESPFSDIYGSKDGRNDYKLDASVTHRYNGGSSIAVDNINKKESGISKLLLESENFENNLKILLKK